MEPGEADGDLGAGRAILYRDRAAEGIDEPFDDGEAEAGAVRGGVVARPKRLEQVLSHRFWDPGAAVAHG